MGQYYLHTTIIAITLTCSFPVAIALASNV